MLVDGWVGADKAAEILGITRKTVYAYSLRAAEFPQPARIGRTVVWREEDLREWRLAHPPQQWQHGPPRRLVEQVSPNH